jgi:hypothetical protein
MQPGQSDTRQADPGFDQGFYRHVIQARAHAELLDCRKIATRSKDERILRAFVAAMFASRTHRRAVSSCIREYIGKRAIPALLWNLDQLPPRQQLFQARLLCMLGHWETLAVYYSSIRALEPLDANTNKSVESFMTNYTPALLPGLRSSLGSKDHGFTVFCAPYLHKYDPLKVSTRLTDIVHESTAEPDARNKALHVLIAFSPDDAVSCLLDCGEWFSLPVLSRQPKVS